MCSKMVENLRFLVKSITTNFEFQMKNPHRERHLEMHYVLIACSLEVQKSIHRFPRKHNNRKMVHAVILSHEVNHLL